MSSAIKKRQPPIEEWTMEDVRWWLMTEVKVQDTCANRFLEEEVSGGALKHLKKTDILDLGIKHGPAVKITCYLEILKKGSQHESQFPDYVENWTKEQVNQWLLQYVKLYGKYAQRLLEEDVSGDCLVCFKKQDFLDLDVKRGPAVNVLGELRQLKEKPEPTLDPTVHTSTDQDEPPKPIQPELSLAQAKETIQPESCEKIQSAGLVGNESGPRQQPSGKTSERREVQRTTVQPPKPKISEWIKITLDDLTKIQLKHFHFELQDYIGSGNEKIPGSKLEEADTMDTTKLMTGCYGNEGALQVTIDILKVINQFELASQLEKKIGQVNQQCLPNASLKKEGTQGDKLKDLLTCGGSSLDGYYRFIVVVNKSCPEQVPYLQFLSKLKLFVVLDFDPNSLAEGGLCHSYGESRVANLHSPAQYQGQTDSVIKNLNLCKQTSWVFCNGRNDLEGDSNKELDYKNWLRKTCRDVEQLVSFICNPEVLLPGRNLIIFLLLSPVDTEKDPIFDTYRSFIKHTQEENIITICESQSTYEKWRWLIQEKCDYDIDYVSISELTLSEVNGTVMAMGPFNESSERLLPSSGSSRVVLKQKDRDLLTALDIMCLNQCEKIYDENSPEFQDFRIKTEEEFYRGGKVKWWNFYFCDKDKEKPFIKRDKYEKVKKMIRSQLRESNNMCVLLNLFHHPGCGGTTLAMHVMWDLRKKLRCAVLKNKTHPQEVASQIIQLMKLESGKPFPVLLLVDDSKDKENPYDLVNCIRKAVEDSTNTTLDDAQNCKVIILNCVRSQSPKEQYRQHNPTQSQYITASLTPQEQKEFKKKLKELKETHEKPENFYSFMIMKSNFDEKYVDDITRNTLENFDFSTKEGQLFAYLALLNTYVSESEISLSLCEDFFKMKMNRWQEKESVLDRIKPYSNFLIIDTVEEWGGYKGIRILHRSIASACLDELEERHELKLSEIVMEMLRCDLFFSAAVVKHRFMLSFRQMLVERQRKKYGDERESLSCLINKINNQKGRETVQKILETAASRFPTTASIPQTLARYLYNKDDFAEALKWAEKAKNRWETPFTCDTIAQVHKKNLKCNINREKKETSHNPEDLDTNIKLANNAIRAFQRAQELAEREEELYNEAADDQSEDDPRKSYTIYGYVGVLEIVFLLFEILGRLPFFDEKKQPLQSFLKGSMSFTSVYIDDTEINNRYVEILKQHKKFLVKLKTEINELFELLNSYFTYIRKDSEYDSKNHKTVCYHYKKYVDLFLTTTTEKKDAQQKNPKIMNIKENRVFLEMNQAHTFAGLIQYLDKPAEEIEKIVQCYDVLQRHQSSNQKQKTKETINYIMSNIVLHISKPKSEYVKSYKDLSDLLLKTLQDVGHQYPFPDPYFLALLLFWPSPTQENTDLVSFVTAIQKSYNKSLSKPFQKRSTIAHLYLGEGQELSRLVSKPQLDENFLPEMSCDNLAQLWWNGDIFKENAIISRLHRVSGVIEQQQVYANYGKLKIPVHPARISGTMRSYSTEKVSFYLGFAINGPLAYDIKYEN